MMFIILKKCGQIHTGLFRSFRFCRFQQTNAFIQIPGHQLVHPFAIFISQGFMGCHPQKLSGCLPVALLDSSRCRIQIGYRMSRVNLYTRFYYLNATIYNSRKESIWGFISATTLASSRLKFNSF